MIAIKISPPADRYLITKIYYDANQNPEYIGYAETGSSTAEAVWVIQKITYDVNENPTDVLLANGSTKYDQIMDNYAAHSYS